MRYTSLAALGVIVGYAAFQRAGVAPSDWNLCLLAVGIVCAVHFSIPRRHALPKADRFSGFMAAVFLAIALFQIIPLPIGIVRIISPARAELAVAAAPFTGGHATYITLSATPYLTMEYVITVLGYLAIFMVVRSAIFESRDMPWTAVWPLFAIAGLEAALGVFQAYVEGGNSIATGTYANRDHYAGLLELVLPLLAMYAVAILQRNRKRYESPLGPTLRACVILALAVLLLVAITLTLSRMGFLAALGSLFISGCIALSVRGWRIDVHVAAPLWRRMVPIVAVAVIVILGFIFLPSDPLIARFSDLAKTDDISADTRAQIWRDSIGLVKAFPLFGCGLGAYDSCFLRFKTVAPMNTIDYAHNDYLQILAELGVFGFIAALLLAMRLLMGTVRAALYAHSIDERFLMIGCTGSLVGILLHSFVDFNLYVPANGAVFAWICGVAASGMSSARVRSKRSAIKVPEEMQVK